MQAFFHTSGGHQENEKSDIYGGPSVFCENKAVSGPPKLSLCRKRHKGGFGGSQDRKRGETGILLSVHDMELLRLLRWCRFIAPATLEARLLQGGDRKSRRRRLPQEARQKRGLCPRGQREPPARHCLFRAQASPGAAGLPGDRHSKAAVYRPPDGDRVPGRDQCLHRRHRGPEERACPVPSLQQPGPRGKPLGQHPYRAAVAAWGARSMPSTMYGRGSAGCSSPMNWPPSPGTSPR